MASGCNISRQRDSFRLSCVLSSAFLEWILMFLLFLNALFSFLVTKFARLCKLQTPCLFCSRLDHILGYEKPDFYKDLICHSHKEEISSLAYCRVHLKLVDVNELCEACSVLSLTSKLGSDLDGFEDNIYEEKDHLFDSLITKHCSCCSMPFKNKSQAINLIRSNTLKVDDDKKLMKKMENSLASPSANHVGNHGFDHLSRVGYSEVKVTSDSESENTNQYSDNDGNHVIETLEIDVGDRCLKPEPVPFIHDNLPTPLSDVDVVEKSIEPASSNLEPSLLIQEERLIHVGESHDDVTLASNVIAVEKSIEPTLTNLQPSLSIQEEQLIHVGESHDDASLASTVTTVEKPIEPTVTNLQPSLSIQEEQLIHVGESHDDDDEVPLASTVAIALRSEEINWNTIETKKLDSTTAVSEILSGKETLKVADLKLNGSGNLNTFTSTTDPDVTTSQIKRDAGPTNMDLNDAYKLAIDSKSNLPSPSVAEVITGRDSCKVHEDLRLLISQFSAARGLDSPWNELSPSPRVYDPANSAILQNITKSLSIERNESLESLDGSIVSEIEGESAVDRLRRQVDLDRKSMHLLYKELEEERSASAIAANQTMAMITRLQEEKASMHMEALQYQRMMEEQSEYDQEALQKLNEVVVQREKEIQDLEAELENYRKQFGDDLATNKLDQSKSYISDFEVEKAYISDCLKRMEEKLDMFSNNGHVDISCKDENGEGSTRAGDNLINSDSTVDNHYFMDYKFGKLEDLMIEISEVSKRLKVLEADLNFLEHTVNTLQIGDEGVKFVQEIACNLQELKRIGITLGEQSVA